ncbi:hypothetical protein Agub_g675, partial [Astrephomene gubernaculifera]
HILIVVCAYIVSPFRHFPFDIPALNTVGLSPSAMSAAACLRSSRGLVRFAAPALGVLRPCSAGCQASLGASSFTPAWTAPQSVPCGSQAALAAAVTPKRCFALDAVQQYLVGLSSSQGEDGV